MPDPAPGRRILRLTLTRLRSGCGGVRETPDVRPDELLQEVAQSESRLARRLAMLTEADLRQPSPLPGWSRAHVVAHLAGNAKAFANALERVAAGEVPEQYPGGRAARDAEIEAWAALARDELLARAADAAASLNAAWGRLDAEAWARGEVRTLAGLLPVAELPFRRLREVEVHLVDLGVGVEPRDWPSDYVVGELDRSLPGLAARLPGGTTLVLSVDLPDGRQVSAELGSGPSSAEVAAPAAEVVAWLVGRLRPEGWPELGPWAPGLPDLSWRS